MNEFIVKKGTRKQSILFFGLFFISVTVSSIIYYYYIGLKNFHFPIYDTLAFDYPLRFFISSAISHGIFPMWNHWTKNGSSLSSLFISFNFSPIILFFSVFGVYSLTTFITEMLFVQIVGFIGMFLWIKIYTNKWIALYSAFCFSITAPIVSTTGHYNILITMSLLPITAYAFHYALRGSFRHVGSITLLLLVFFTTGYLGTNMMFLTVLFTYCLLEFYFQELKSSQHERRVKLTTAIEGITVTLLLFFSATSYQWIEAWNSTKFHFTSLRASSFNPFDGATSFYSLLTLLFTHNFPSAIRFSKIMSAPGVTSMMYIGLLNIAFFIYALFHKKAIKNIMLLLFFIVLTFFLSLYAYTSLLRFILLAIPFLKITRWHGWYSALLVFFFLTVSAQGMFYFITHLHRNEMKKMFYSELFVLTAVVFAGLILIKRSQSLGNFIPYFISQIVWISVLMILTFLAVCLSKGKKQSYIFLLLLCCIGLGEYIGNAVMYLTPRDIWTYEKEARSAVHNVQTFSDSSFSGVTNERSTSLAIDPLISQKPNLNGYTQSEDPILQRLRKNVGDTEYTALTKYIFYIPDAAGKPISALNTFIAITKFYPNEIVLSITGKEQNQTVVWSSPYSPYWYGYRNGSRIQTQQSPFGLTTFHIPSGKNIIILQYRPWYFYFCLFFLFLSYLTIVWLFLTNKNPVTILRSIQKIRATKKRDRKKETKFNRVTKPR